MTGRRQSDMPAIAAASAALSAVTSLPVVAFTLEGATVLGAFELNEMEHARRRAVGAGSVTSTGLLHGLWQLPTDGQVELEAIPTVKRRRLREASNFVAVMGGSCRRLYAPAGVVRAVGVRSSSLHRALDRADRLPPILQRFVIVDPKPKSSVALMRAQVNGIGVLSTDASLPEAVVPAGPAEVGVPAVYRWWLAELAYEAWLYESAQPVS